MALWKQTQGRTLEISCQVKTFHSTTMDFSLPSKQTFPLIHSFFLPACSTTTLICKHTDIESCEFSVTYSLGGNRSAEGTSVSFEC